VTTNTPVSWGLKPPPRDLETAPPPVKARLQYAQTVLVSASFAGAAAGGCLLANALALPGWYEGVGLALVGLLLALGPFLIGRAFERDTRASLRDAPATRFVVVSVEKVSNPPEEWRGHHVGLRGVDRPELEAGIVTAALPDDFAADGEEVVGLPTVRGEYLVVGLTERDVFSARPSATVPRHLRRGA